MLTFAPPIPRNLKNKLEAAVKRFQLKYDNLTLADARRLLARYHYKMPVLAALQLHGNGALKEVILRENLKRLEPREGWIAADLAIFGHPAEGQRELWTPFIRSIVAGQALKCREAGWFQTDKLSDEELDRLLQQLPLNDYGRLDIKDASFLMLRMMAEMERKARENESNHEALKRLSRPVPQALVDELSREKEDALLWLKETSAIHYLPALNYDIDLFSTEDHIVIAYRDHQFDY
jgi:hypothetical protein